MHRMCSAASVSTVLAAPSTDRGRTPRQAEGTTVRTFLSAELCRVDGCGDAHCGWPLCELHWAVHFGGACLKDDCENRPARFDYVCREHVATLRAEGWTQEPVIVPSPGEVSQRLLELARIKGEEGMSVRAAASWLHSNPEPTERQYRYTWERLTKLRREGLLDRVERRGPLSYWVLREIACKGAPAGNGSLTVAVTSRRRRDTEYREKQPRPLCDVADCGLPIAKWGLCDGHLAAWRAEGYR